MTDQQPSIIFEDDELLVVSKPAGMIVNRADSVKEPTMQDWLDERYAHDEAWLTSKVEDVVFDERSGLGHRLDKDTSGMVVVGKTSAALKNLLEQFQARTVKKTYQALVHGFMPVRAGVVEAPIARDTQNRQRFTVDEGGRQSRTLFHVAEEYKGVNVDKLWERWPHKLTQTKPAFEKQMEQIYQGFSFVSLQPKTGRTHQLRVHMKFLAHPIVGDIRYNSARRGSLDSKWVPRQFLHAAQITINHPRTGESKTFSAPLPPELQKVLTYLEPR